MYQQNEFINQLYLVYISKNRIKLPTMVDIWLLCHKVQPNQVRFT